MKFFKEYRSTLIRRTPGIRRNLLIVALESYPSGLFKTSIGITLLGAPFLLNYFSEMGVTSLVVRILLNGLSVVLFPALLLLIYSLIRAPKMRRQIEEEELRELGLGAERQERLKLQKKDEEIEVGRLRDIVITESETRRVKDALEDARWNSLNERLRVQEHTRQVGIDLREQRDVARQDHDSIERLDVARKVKNVRDHEQRESGKREDAMKIERDEARTELAVTVIAAQQEKQEVDNERWNGLHERLRAQELKNESRDAAQQQRDDNLRLERKEDQLVSRLDESYRTLLDRYIRHAHADGWPLDVADGLAPIPGAWLEQQPEILNDPALLQSLASRNKR